MIIRIALATLFLAILALPAVAQTGSAAAPQVKPSAKLAVEKLNIIGAGHKIIPLAVEMAVTQDEQIDGLMGRTSLGPHEGMLFLFDKADNVSFWMKDTLIPLDMLFIDQHGRIFNIFENAKPEDLSPIRSNGPAKAVIEIAGGGAKTHGIKVGNTVEYKAFH